MNLNTKILVSGGAGFIGSNLCDFFVKNGFQIVCLDNFSTGFKSNIEHLIGYKNFKLIEGDIRNFNDCQKAVLGVDFVLHQAALGSVPRSISDPISTNDVNISGFLNLLTAARDAKVKRFIYAASSSTYGDSTAVPKIEDTIGKPLSPYAITKYVNELYATIFSNSFGIETIGLRYFNVFGKNQDPNGAYAAVIPKFVKQFINHQSPVINGDGGYSRDFTYIDNVIQMNELAMNTENPLAINTIYNTAFGQKTTILKLAICIKEELSKFDAAISEIPIAFGKNREGDIPHSLASIQKAQDLLGYNPKFSLEDGLKMAIEWYWYNMK